MEDKILISSGWCRVHSHHKLTGQSESISHDLDPFWPAETLFKAVTTKICSHLFRYDSEPLVNFMCCRDMATSIDTLPLEMLCHIFSFLGSDILLVCWNVSRSPGWFATFWCFGWTPFSGLKFSLALNGWFVGNFFPHCPSHWNSDKVQRVSQPDLEAM